MASRTVIATLGGLAVHSLGSADMIKCVEDGHQHCYVSCTSCLLSNLDIQHPVGQLITSLVCSHHDRYGSCSRTLVAMTMFWYQEATTLIDMGVPVHAVVRYMNEALDSCIDHVKQSSLSLEDIERHVLLQKCVDPKLSCPSLLNAEQDGSADGQNCTQTRHFYHSQHNSVLPESLCLSRSPFYNADINTESTTNYADSEQKQNVNCQTDIEPSRLSLDSKSSCQDVIAGCPGNRGIINDMANWQESKETLNFCEKSRNVSDVEDDDIGWFFDDGKIPDVPTIEDEALASLERVASILDASGFTDKTTGVCHEAIDERKKSTAHLSNKFPSESLLSVFLGSDEKNGYDDNSKTARCGQASGKINQMWRKYDDPLSKCSHDDVRKSVELSDTDDEFDSCFEGVKFLDESAVKSNNVHVLNKSTAEVTWGNNTTRDCCYGKKPNRDIENLEGEFISCFDDIEFQKDSNCAKHVLKDTSHENYEKDSGFHENIPENSFRDFDHGAYLTKKLNEILKENFSTRRLTIKNQSRHFKTIETTVEHLHGNQQGYDSKKLTLEPKHDRKLNIEQSQCDNNKSTVSDVSNDADTKNELQQIYRNDFETSMVVCDLSNENTSDDSNVFVEFIKTEYTNNSSAETQSSEVEPISSSSLKRFSNLNISDSDVFKSKEIYSSALEKVKDENNSIFSRMKLKSRHLMESEINDPENPHRLNMNPDLINDENKVRVHTKYRHDNKPCGDLVGILGKGLSHGCFKEMDLVIEITRTQNKDIDNFEDLCLDFSHIHTLLVHGPSEKRMGVVPGLVVKTTVAQMTQIEQHPKADCHVTLLMNGDMSERFRHKGFTQSVSIRTIASSLSVTPSQPFQIATQMLEKLGVTLVLVKGTVAPPILDYCINHNIIVLENVSHKALVEVSIATKAELMTYITDADEDCLGRGVRVQPWSCDWMDEIDWSESRCYASLILPHLSQTAVLTHTCKSMLPVAEERFWHCASRTRNCLHHGRVLLGAGRAEAACVDHLTTKAEQSLVEDSSHDDFKSVIIEAIRNGYLRYASHLQVNIAAVETATANQMQHNSDGSSLNTNHISRHKNCDFQTPQESIDSRYISSVEGTFAITQIPSKFGQNPLCIFHRDNIQTSQNWLNCEIFDDFTAKIEAWKSALCIITGLLQTDSHIVTGENAQLSTGPVL